jgi:di/tricarboxylate transporter
MREEQDEVDSPDDFPFRVQLVNSAAFLATLAALTQVPRLWGSEWLWQHFSIVAVVLGFAWLPLGLRFGTRWTRRLRSAPRTDPRDDDKAIRRDHQVVRRHTAWYVFRLGVTLLAVPLLIAGWFVGADATKADQRLIDTQPYQTAVVVQVARSPLSRGHGPDSVTVELDGRSVKLGLSFPGDDHVKVGDRLEVVQDPNDPSYVIAANSHRDWAYSTWGALAIYVLIAAFLLLIVFPGFPGRSTTRGRGRHARRPDHLYGQN